MALNSTTWQKVQPSSTLGTPALDFYVLEFNVNIETGYLLSNSTYSKAVLALQTVADLYFIGKPNTDTYITFAIRSGSCPGSNPGAISGQNSYLEAAITDATGLASFVYYADFDGHEFIFNN